MKAEPENEEKPIILKRKLASANGNKKVSAKKVKEETLPAVSKNDEF